MQFQVAKIKAENPQANGKDKFDLSDPRQRRAYFDFKVGDEIKKIGAYLAEGNTFIGYLLGKKNSGKGTYSKLFIEIFGEDHVGHISVGDIVRDVHSDMKDPQKSEKLHNFLKKRYRGYISIYEAVERLLSRETKSLLPTEFILALVEHRISEMPKKALFIDGFPRDLDQVSYSLYFRELVGYRDDPDFFIIIDIPKSVIDERIKNRAICPVCQTPRNLKLLRTKEIGYDQKSAAFYLICDNPACQGARMVRKEGDDLGIETISDRLEMDQKLIEQALDLHGIPKILLRNSVPVEMSKTHVDDYEITPEYQYFWDSESASVKVEEKPWVVKDDQQVASYSLLAPPVVVSMLQQMVEALGL